MRRFSVRIASLLALSGMALTLANAQSTDDEPPVARPSFSNVGPPPNFTPPPPPSFTPPTTSPGSSTTPSATTGPRVVTAPSEEELLQRPSSIIDTDDPDMEEIVGMIRIPEMGTNEVIEMLENFTRKPVLRQQTLPSVKITFFSQDTMTRAQAITALESLLALNGIAITNLGEDFLKAVPSAVINNQVARVWEGSTLDAVPSMTIYEKIFELSFLTSEEAVSLLQPLMTGGSPLAFDKSNLLLISDSLINLQRIERLLPILDKPSKIKTEMLFFELQNINAQEVSERIDKLAQGPLRKQLDGNTTTEPDERTNQLIVFTHPTNATLIRKLIERLDIDVAPATATNVYSIRYADATEVVNILEQIISGQREIRQDASGGSGTQANAAAAQAARERAAATRKSNAAAAAARSDATNLQFSDFLTIVPDERANTIVANGTHSDLSYLEQLIDQIDSLLAQVRIEVIIAEVRLDEDDIRGIDSFGFGYSGDGFEIDLEDPGNSWTASPGDFYGVSFGDGISWAEGVFSFEIALQAINENSDAKILSAPTIVTTHNKEATVSVGEQRPVITGTTSTNLTSDTAATTRDTVQYRDINLELTVTPLIGSNGIVQLEIEQTIQRIIDFESVNGNLQPVIGNRAANSYVSVENGGLIVLGGLQSLETSDTQTRMAILGNLPVVGDLFSKTATEMIRQELLIFIRPTILRTSEEAHADASKMVERLKESESIHDYLDSGEFSLPEKESEEDESEDKELPRRYGP